MLLQSLASQKTLERQQRSLQVEMMRLS